MRPVVEWVSAQTSQRVRGDGAHRDAASPLNNVRSARLRGAERRGSPSQLRDVMPADHAGFASLGEVEAKPFGLDRSAFRSIKILVETAAGMM
jgi:hypothetical protein